MNQSDRTGLVLVFVTLLVAIIFGLAMGIEGRFNANRSVAALTPDPGMSFGANVVADAVLVALFSGLAVDAKLLLSP